MLSMVIEAGDKNPSGAFHSLLNNGDTNDLDTTIYS